MMNSLKSAVWTAWKEAWNGFSFHWRSLVGFQIVYGLGVAVAFWPLVHLLMGELVSLSGDKAITNFDLTSFFLSGKGMAFLALGGLAGLVSWRVQQSTLILMTAEWGTSPFTALREVLTRMVPLMAMTFIQLGTLLLLHIPFGLLLWGISRFLLGEQDINFYLHTHPPQWYAALALAGLGGAATLATAIGVGTRWAYVLPLVLRVKLPAFESLRRSFQYTRGNWLLPLVTIGGFWLLMTLVSNTLSTSVLGVGRLVLPWVGTHTGLAILIVLIVFGTVSLNGIVTGTVGMIMRTSLINRLFDQVAGVEPEHLPPPSAKDRKTFRRVTIGFVVGALILISMSGAWWVRRMNLSDQVRITAHRGSSAAAPENTLSALKQALKDGADFAEIDVQTTKDGEVVLLHDRDLMRMGRDPRDLASLTLKELQTIDVGLPFGEAFRGERVPTLKEALLLVRGRMGLNIELKYNIPDPTLAPRVIERVKETRMLNSCVITSLDLESLRQAESVEPRLETGLIVTKALGDPTKLGVDFLSLNQKTLTRSLVRRAKRQGLAIHVWTVNDEATFERMADRGVDVVITDHPADLAALRRARAALSKPELVALRLRRLLLEFD
jgi:glycerophosphoryl diester phosphodiesterase